MAGHPISRIDLHQFLHRDGATVAIVTVTDAAGDLAEQLAFDPHGRRREADWKADLTGSLIALETPRGFTGHEHLDTVGLIHMNGRVYDPVLGRFLSADPFIAYPETTQGFNRYSYVDNNPLSYTDPSGFHYGFNENGFPEFGNLLNNSDDSDRGNDGGVKSSDNAPKVSLPGPYLSAREIFDIRQKEQLEADKYLGTIGQGVSDAILGDILR